jgi:transposase-like protein
MGKFPNEQAARLHLEKLRWKGKPVCPTCNNDTKQFERKGEGRSGYYLCKNCGLEYTVRTGTIFERSHIPLSKWLLAAYFIMTARKGVSSMQLSKELGITQKSAWFMLHRIREVCSDSGPEVFKGEVEADGGYFGGKEENKHASKKRKAGRGVAGKTPVLGIRERGGAVKGIVLGDTSAKTIQGELNARLDKDATLYTDEHPSYQGNQFKHKAVNHSVKKFVDEMAHTNGMESFWALLKRGHYGTYHKMSAKHLQKYVDEFAFRHNEGNVKYPTMDRIDSLYGKSPGKRLTYKRLKGSQMKQLNEALKLGALKILNERELPVFISTSEKRILESKNPDSKTVNDIAKEASNIKCLEN